MRKNIHDEKSVDFWDSMAADAGIGTAGSAEHLQPALRHPTD